MLPKQTNYSVGVYLRLSQEDMREGESLSIENQRKILIKYVEEQQNWTIYDEYVDDGFSGTDFSRPGVQRMLDDAKTGKINLIICKDLSRFGRNYIQVGQYIDYIFPMYNIRFIALNDNIDTANSDSTAMDMMPIMNVFNEWHAANTSKKIRAVKKETAKAGKYNAPFAPYGYLKGSPDDNFRPVIDEKAAGVVKRIFEMRATGLSPKQIAYILNEEGVICPSEYRCQKSGKFKKRVTSGLWGDCSVRDILKNPIYIGSLAQLRTTTVSYKNHKVIRKDESDWIVVENNHEPIISQELWDKCREVDASVSRAKPTKAGEILPLTGMMYCADCGFKMKKNTVIHHNKYGDSTTDSYRCGLYVRSGKCGCTPHSILKRVIEGVIIDDIRSKASLVIENEKEARSIFIQHKNALAEHQTEEERQLLAKNECRLAELEQMIQKIYEDKLLGKMPEDFCEKMLSKYLVEQAGLAEKIAVLREKAQQSNKDIEDVEHFMRLIRRYADITELTREIVLDLIEYIVIGDKTDDEPRKIHIYYKFLDKQLDDARNYLLNEN